MSSAELGAAKRSPLSISDLPRLARLRERLLAAPKAVCAERARLLTEFHLREGFTGPRAVLRRARALDHVLAGLPVPVFEDELIVGSTTRHRLGCVMYPELLGALVWPELPTIGTRAFDPVAVSDEDAALLGEQVFPAWADHTVHEHARRAGSDPASLALSERIVFYLLAKSNGLTHVIPDYPSVVSRGLAALAADARRRAAAAADDEARELLEAMVVALEATIRLAERYARACEELAASAGDARAQELTETAAVLRRVPREPSRTLHEALQAVWLTHVALHQECNDVALSFGRMDQYLYPVYEADVAAGRIDRARALELLGCFFLKVGDHVPLIPLTGQEMMSGASTNQAMTIGGVRADGSDASNELSYRVLEVTALLALREPNMSARLHAGTPEPFRRALAETIYRTGATPALYNDAPIIEALVAQGVAPEHAADYGIVGCVEPTSCYRSMGMTGGVMLNLAVVLEMALFGGVHPLSGQQIGPPTPPLSRQPSYAGFEAAFVEQLQHLAGQAVEADVLLDRGHAELCPTPLLSALVRGAAESGRDVTRGGARYDSSGVTMVGLADVVDSLTALEELVFGQGLVTPAEMLRALADDFVGHERLLAALGARGARFGNDIDQIDRKAVWLVRLVGETFAQQRSFRGGPYHVGYWSLTTHCGFGALTGALPSGRRAGAPLAPGVGPCAGAAREGPTAALASVHKLPPRWTANGMGHNLKLSRSLLGAPGRLAVLEQLLAGFVAGGGMQVQITVQDRDVLLAAQRDPAAHRDLLVRVSGYTAYFCDLNRQMQDEILSRTEHGA